MFYLKPPTSPKKGTLPRHLWPKQVRQDISCIRRRAKVIRRLLGSESQRSDESPQLDHNTDLWTAIGTPITLRTALSPPPKHLDTLGVLVSPDSLPENTTLL